MEHPIRIRATNDIPAEKNGLIIALNNTNIAAIIAIVPSLLDLYAFFNFVFIFFINSNLFNIIYKNKRKYKSIL